MIDILVNNAGIIKRIPMRDVRSRVQTGHRCGSERTVYRFKAVIPSMIKKGHGKIINICSMMSELGRETVSAYAAAKGGLKMLTRNIASEYGEYNIQCNGIGPGYIATRRPHRSARSSRTEADIRLTSSSSQRLRQQDGEAPRIYRDRQYS